MTTVLQLLTDACSLIGVTAGDDALTGGEAQQALRVFNRMIETWNTQRLMVYTINRNTYPLTTSQQTYTLGTGGTFNAARPVRIENASIIPTASAPTLEIPIQMLRDEQWQEIPVKSVTSTFPTMVYPDGAFPLNTLSFWPIPTAACSVVLYTWNQIQPYSDLTASLSLPNGYEEPLVYNLAVRLAAFYGVEPLPSVLQIAMRGKAFIASQNWTPDELRCDPALVRGTGLLKANRSFGYLVD